MPSTLTNVCSITQDPALLHGGETDVFAHSSCRGVEKREEIQVSEYQPDWHGFIEPCSLRSFPCCSDVTGMGQA